MPVVHYWNEEGGYLYAGEMREGDRLASSDEIENHYGNPLQNARNRAFEALREKRKEVEYGGFIFNGKKWDSEIKDELRLNSIVKMFELTGVTEFDGWKISENEYITITPEIIHGAAITLMQHYAHSFAIEAIKQAEIGSLTDPQEIETWIQTQLDIGW